MIFAVKLFCQNFRHPAKTKIMEFLLNQILQINSIKKLFQENLTKYLCISYHSIFDVLSSHSSSSSYCPKVYYYGKCRTYGTRHQKQKWKRARKDVRKELLVNQKQGQVKRNDPVIVKKCKTKKFL